MKNEITFEKYKSRGADYHFRQIDKGNRSTFNSFVFARYQIELELIAKLLKPQKSKEIKILDIGCGEGVVLYLINQKFNKFKLHLYGADSSDIALDAAKIKNPFVSFNKADLYNLPYDENSFDLVISSDVIEHTSKPHKMLEEIKRVGKESCKVIIGTPIRYTEKPLDRMHYHEFYPNEFKELLTESFNTVKLIQSHKLAYTLLYEKVSTIFKKEIQIYRYLINLLTIYFKINPFMKIKRNDRDIYSYMFAIGNLKK